MKRAGGTHALVQVGYGEAAIAKIWGGDFLRAWAAAQASA